MIAIFFTLFWELMFIWYRPKQLNHYLLAFRPHLHLPPLPRVAIVHTIMSFKAKYQYIGRIVAELWVFIFREAVGEVHSYLKTIFRAILFILPKHFARLFANMGATFPNFGVKFLVTVLFGGFVTLGWFGMG